MARLSRLTIPHQVHHLTQSGVDSRLIFADEDDYKAFYQWLKVASLQFQVDIHAYVLLPDRFHLLATPHDELGLGKMIQLLGRYYVPYFNVKYQRRGTLWQGRFKASVLETEKYFLPCCVMIEEAPIRDGLVMESSEYPWSSCQHHLGMQQDALLVDHHMIWNLGNTPFQREAAYKQCLNEGLSSFVHEEINEKTHKSWVLGSPHFLSELGGQTERRLKPISRGRPRKSNDKDAKQE
jgi:putative transposase